MLKSVSEVYSHGELDVETEEEYHRRKDRERLRQYEKRMQQLDKEEKGQEDKVMAKTDGEMEEAKDKASVGSAKPKCDLSEESERRVDFEIYYDRAEIKNAYRQQKRDLFKEFDKERKMLLEEKNGLEGLKSSNIIDISKYAPADPSLVVQVNRRKSMRKRKISAVHTQFEEAEREEE